MDGYLILHKAILKEVMLNQGIRIFLILSFLAQSCKNDDSISRTKELKNISLGQISYKQYTKIYSSANDSLNLWILNNFSSYGFIKGRFECQLDSLLAFNSQGTRFISCLLEKVLVRESDNDGLIYFYGEKINDKWYFFKGASFVIPRSMHKDHEIHTPLSYQQLHEIALKEVYSGYLTRNGSINEDWFTQNFEGAGWGNFNNQAASDFLTHGKRFTNKKDFFEYMHLMVVKANWNGFKKDSVIP